MCGKVWEHESKGSKSESSEDVLGEGNACTKTLRSERRLVPSGNKVSGA